jgi:hypothetical protein
MAILMVLCAWGCSSEDEVEAETAAILAHLPRGAPFNEAAVAIRGLGFSCTTGQRQFTDAKGKERDAEPHLSCEREERYWLACTKRTRAILLQLNGRLSNVLVNVGRFCG